MTRFRPCIDLHAGKVKQIVGGTLKQDSSDPKTNHVSNLPASHFAKLYRQNGLRGGHIIMLGPGNDDACHEALAAWPEAFHVGGGVNDKNAMHWINSGAEKVIVTSFIFPDTRFSLDRLKAILNALDNDKNKLVIDLSCRKEGHKWIVAMNKWQTLTNMELNQASIKLLEPYCSEFLVHAADREGLRGGIDCDLVSYLDIWCSIPVTYAGGGKVLDDLACVRDFSEGRIDLTIGSALDIFGGDGVTLEECVEWNRSKTDYVPED